MKLNKSNITTLFLIIIIVVISFSIFYLNIVLNQGTEKQSAVAPRKTKAASVSYSKTVGLGSDTGVNTGDTILSPTVMIPTEGIISPTETLLAYQNQSTTPTGSVTPRVTGSLTTTPSLTTTVTASPSGRVSSISPTQVKSLPKSGIVQNSLIMFSVAGLFIFFAFLF